MKYLSKSVDETNKVAEAFLSNLDSYISSYSGIHHALVVGLFGDLGSGKTTFTQALGSLFKIKEEITSPTFVIEKIYLLKDNKKYLENYLNLTNFERLIHIDAYRLESGKELLSLGFTEIINDPKNLILIEWPERILDILPSDLFKINFKFISEFEREIVF